MAKNIRAVVRTEKKMYAGGLTSDWGEREGEAVFTLAGSAYGPSDRIDGERIVSIRASAPLYREHRLIKEFQSRLAIRDGMSELGRKKSPQKARAARKNARLGGRPPKGGKRDAR